MADVAGRLAGLVRDLAGMDLPVGLQAWDGSRAGPIDAPVLVIRNRRALRRLLWAPGELGLARAYVTGDLDVDGDLADGFRRVWQAARAEPSGPAVFSAQQRMRAVWRALRLGAVGPPPAPPAAEARLTGRLHTRGRDRAAISHHYDLSNDFYRLLLDEQMVYSSAYFVDPDQTLDEAQTAKLDLICRKLGLRPGMWLLDVGCGWGSLICYAAKHYGVHATGITLAERQRAFVDKRISENNLTGSVEVKLRDYRDLAESPGISASFDAVSSIEMGEHVGEEHYPHYAAIMFDALKPSGRLLLQQMSRTLDSAPGGGAFIERYIAPDMHMRPLWQTLRHLQNASFEVLGVEAMREHYSRTAQHWVATLEANWGEFVALVGEQTARVWRLYLVGGGLAFDEGRMGVDQILAARPPIS